MYPTKLKLSNFLSFEELEYDFEKNPVLLMGENKTDEGQESNGSGKTAIQSAIEKCWLDYTSRKKVRDLDLIKYGKDIATLESWIYCPVRKEELHIKRILTKKGNKLELFINEEPVSFATVNDGNNFIIEWIGISKEDLSNYYVVNKKRFISFFSSSNTQKLELLGRFSNTSFLEKIDTDIKSSLVELKGQEGKLQSRKSELVGKISLLQQQIEEITSEKFEQEKSLRIKALNDKKEKIRALQENNKEKLNELIVNIKKYQQSISNAGNQLLEVKQASEELIKKHSQFEKHVEELENELNHTHEECSLKRNELNEMNQSKMEVDKALFQIETLLSGVIECPNCSHRFILHQNVDVEEEEKKFEELKALGDEVKLQCTLINEDLNKIIRKESEKMSEVKAERGKNNEFLSKIASLQKQIISIEENIAKNESEIENANSRKGLIKENDCELEQEFVKIDKLISEIEKEEFDLSSQTQDLECKKSDFKSQLEGVDKELQTISLSINEHNEWLIQYKEFKMYLANISIKEIQCHCNEILKDMDSDLRVSIDGFKQKADGTVKDEITPMVIRDRALTFDSFSGGEGGRLEYAMILTQQAMINKANPYGGMEFLFTDEIAEGIDALGLRLLVKSLSNFHFPILITTHVVNQAVGSRVLKVVKENNNSRIER